MEVGSIFRGTDVHRRLNNSVLGTKHWFHSSGRGDTAINGYSFNGNLSRNIDALNQLKIGVVLICHVVKRLGLRSQNMN